MVVTQRQKTGRTAETARRPRLASKQPQARSSTAKDPSSRRPTAKEPPNEYADLKEGIRNLWVSWTATTNTCELWRRIEQTGMDNALKKLSQTRADLSIITTLSTEDAVNLTAVMVEFAELLNCIRLAFVDNEKEIFDKDEQEKRFLTTTSPHILELWCNFSSFASNFAANIAQRCWHNSSEEKELLRMTVEVAAASVKLLVLSIDVARCHNSSEVDNLHAIVLRETEGACKDLQDFIRKVTALGEDHSTRDAMVEMIGWKLYGIYHLCAKVIKPGIEAKDPERTFEEYDALIPVIEDMVKEIRKFRGEQEKEPEATPAPEPLQKKQSPKKGGKTPRNAKVEIKESKDVKTEQQISTEETKRYGMFYNGFKNALETAMVNEPSAFEPMKFYYTCRSKENCLESLQKVSDAYDKYSDDAWENKQLPTLQGTSGVKIKYRMECYDQIGRTSVKPCPMTLRKEMLKGLALSEDYTITSDIYIFDPEGLVCTKEVTIEMPVMSLDVPEKGEIILKVKADGSWSDCKVFEKTYAEEGLGILFNTQSCEAFTMVMYSTPAELVVGTTGANYISEDFGKVEINIPPDCYDHETTLRIKTIPFDTSSYPSLFVGVISASVGIEVSPADSYDDSYTEMKKHMVVQLPVEDDDEDKDTELVVVRYDGENVQVLDKKQMAVKAVANGLYTVDVKGYWCLAILRIRRIFLNMRDSIKKEFLLGYKKKTPCHIVTFIDHMTRANEKQTFIMEAVEKCNVESVVESKREFGLIEIKKGRSKEVFLKRGEQIQMLADGQMRPAEVLSDDHNILCYVHGLSNVIHVATEIKREPEKLPDAMLFYKHLPDETVVHSVAMMTRDLSELPTEEITARTITNVNMMDSSKRSKDTEDSALKVLKMESLMSLARELTFDEGSQLGQQLGVKPEQIQRFKEEAETDPVGANFQILCHWRGRFARSTMADFLVSSLKAVGKPSYAELITEVRRHNRGLERTDFQRKKSIDKRYN